MKKIWVSMLSTLLVLLLCLPALAEDAAATGGAVAESDKYGNVVTDISMDALYDAKCEVGDLLAVKLKGETEITMPLVTSYSDVNLGETLARAGGADDNTLCLAINMGNFTETYALEPGSTVEITIAEKAGYREQYEIRHLIASTERSDFASDEIFANFRPIVGGTIAEDTLYRSGSPILADDVRTPYVLTLVENAGIKTIINLAQTNEEIAEMATGYYKDLCDAGNVIGLDLNVDFSSDEFIAGLKSGLEFMAAHEGPYLIHCNEGKDRAGVTAALLEGLMGMSADEIIADYMTSFENLYGVQKDTEKYSLISQTITTAIETWTGTPIAEPGLDARLKAFAIERIGASEETITAVIANLSAASAE